MNMLGAIILVIYTLCLIFILSYSVIQLILAINYISGKSNNESKPSLPEKIPFVTVQLPVFNEKYVVERIIDATVKFDYPSDRFEIQILDDSTDETTAIIKKKIKILKEFLTVDIIHIHRENRQGFKAGAMAEATPKAKGEFIAIFDADFVPSVDFLKQTIPYFEDDNIGVVQTRWGHLNESYSILTKLQAFALNAHFTVEQGGRNNANHFINFNGTAGVWRKSCIEDAGGWESDTLTEDLDLSYRAQLKGWKFKYLEHVGSPAELPAAMNALKTQQFRWTKGAAECSRKNLIRVLKNKTLPFSTKVHAIFHLMNSSVFLCILTLALLSVPLFFIQRENMAISSMFKYRVVFMASLVFLTVFYGASMNVSKKGGFKKYLLFLVKFPLFLCFSMGLSLHNAIAVFEGFIGKKTPFVRTPKFNIQKKSDQWFGNKYLLKKLGWLTYVEGFMCLYFIFGIAAAIFYHDYKMLAFHIMLAIGYGAIFFYSIKHTLQS